MKPNTKSVFFKLSLVCFVVLVVQLFVTQRYVQHAVNDNLSTAFISPLYWLGLLWVSLGSTFFYKATKNDQTLLKQALVFILSPIIFAPVIGILYLIIVILPLYGQVSQNSFGN